MIKVGLFHISIPLKRKLSYACVLTCFIAVTVITKNKGSPLVIGEVGVSIINCKGKHTNMSPNLRCSVKKPNKPKKQG